MSGEGDDFSNGGLNGNETFAGEGNDLVLSGDGPDAVFGGGGDDWQEGGNSNDLLQGDSGAPFFDDINAPGHDVLIGDSGEDDYDAEGGDDVMVAGPGIERNHGVFGFDWVTHARSIEPADSDMRQIIVDGPNALKDRFLLVEALSGWDKDDVLRGDDEVPSVPNTEVNVEGLTNELDAAGIARISGLADLLPEVPPPSAPATSSSAAPAATRSGATAPMTSSTATNGSTSGSASSTLQGAEIRTVTTLTELQADIMAGNIDPGNVKIVREILSSPGEADIDTAAFSGAHGRVRHQHRRRRHHRGPRRRPGRRRHGPDHQRRTAAVPRPDHQRCPGRCRGTRGPGCPDRSCGDTTQR